MGRAGHAGQLTFARPAAAGALRVPTFRRTRPSDLDATVPLYTTPALSSTPFQFTTRCPLGVGFCVLSTSRLMRSRAYSPLDRVVRRYSGRSARRWPCPRTGYAHGPGVGAFLVRGWAAPFRIMPGHAAGSPAWAVPCSLTTEDINPAREIPGVHRPPGRGELARHLPRQGSPGAAHTDGPRTIKRGGRPVHRYQRLPGVHLRPQGGGPRGYCHSAGSGCP